MPRATRMSLIFPETRSKSTDLYYCLMVSFCPLWKYMVSIQEAGPWLKNMNHIVE